MLRVITRYDEGTEDNYNCFLRCIRPNVNLNGNFRDFVGNQATKLNLEANINSKDNIFIMSHGFLDSIKETKTNNLVDLASSIINKKIFSYSCLSGVFLGKYLSSNNLYVGFLDEIATPLTRTPQEIRAFEVCFEYLINNYPNIQNKPQAQHFIDDLNNIVLKAISILTQPDMAIMQAIRDIYSYIVIYVEEKKVTNYKGISTAEGHSANLLNQF